ncbi:TRAP transporter small permease [Nitratireductor soli]|uniref:TRAP transporter small permease n=1 Tax=Nitratireductor soli TaxID=1670619 RepID=UPI0009E4DCBB|nr:TRAP transporter small permease [Nitratireductor soli]
MSPLSEVHMRDVGWTLGAGNLLKGINFVLEAMAVVLISLLALLVFANALGRYLFAAPLPWTEEVVVNILVWVAATGIVLAALRQSLICCNILADRLPRRGTRFLAVGCAVLGAAVMAYFSWLTWQYLMIFGGDKSPILGLPKSIAITGLFFASAGLSASLAISILNRKG